MLRSIAPVAALLLSAAFLLMGNGLQNTLTPVRGSLDGFSSLALGLLGGGYYAGFALGCLGGPTIVRRAGHIRAFAAMVAVASAAALLQAMFVNEFAWILFRAATGVCMAVLFMVIESWLGEKSTNETRGRIFSVYIVINLSVVSIGQLLLTLDDATSFVLFALASILVSLAAVPLAMTTSEQPHAPQVVQIRLTRLYRISPVGMMGAFAVGLANGAFWMLGPVYAQSSGGGATATATFMAIGAIAGALGQWPLGYASDRMDRRRVVVCACIGACVAGIAMFAFGGVSPTARLVCVAAFCAFAIPVYSLVAAHLNDTVEGDGFVEAAGALLLTFSLGAVAGPIVGSAAMSVLGPAGLFAYTAVIHLLLIAFTVFRMRTRAVDPSAERGDFVEASVHAITVAPVEPFGDGEPEPETENENKPSEPAA